MPLLPCLHCDQKISVAISQAGSTVTCPGCKQELQIPKLGELRQLAAQAESPDRSMSANPSRGAVSEPNSGRRMMFAALLAIMGTAAMAGLFCLVRYLVIEVSVTTQTHLEEIEHVYKQVPAAQLVREWQQMEKYGLDVATPYAYKKMEIEKASWGRNTLICLAVFTVAGGLASVLGLKDSRRRLDTKVTS